MEPPEDGELAALLPEDVLVDVLRRVTGPRSLAVSRCVCKAWRAIIDGEGLLRRQLPFSGIFICFRRLCLPEFFSRPASAGQPAISGKLDFLPRATELRPHGNCYIEDHCNGLLLLQGTYIDYHYVLNPATRWWNTLPLCLDNCTGGIVRGDYYLAFDPTVSCHYQVFQIPSLRWGKDEIDPLEETSEWPPSPYILHVFSSRRGCWEERLFVREGDAAGTVAKARVLFEGQRNSVYWRGSLYVRCQSDFVMRISLSEDKYSVIKPPMDIGWSSYLGLSEKGVYCASFVENTHIRVYALTESCDQFEWILKNDYDLKPVQMFDGQVNGPWILEDINYEKFRSHLPNINKEEVIQEKFEWNSDDDDFHENLDIVEVQHRPYFEIEVLGFHPYKEILFLSRSEDCKLNAMAFAYHLNSFKVENLGSIYPTGHDYFSCSIPNESHEIDSFPYTPCWIEETPERVN
ncbi:uncharacterized protein LOC125547718 [Triticum urartu]|nr:uncharacterized protein LOC125547718 [Triticum urartu]